mmetsp:Transcript_30477/g.71097  ORF Transcript_30477/g.71097 Transcript_30477/m.71097 type:complete len:180 (-) Transcript_30477:118-657(-)
MWPERCGSLICSHCCSVASSQWLLWHGLLLGRPHSMAELRKLYCNRSLPISRTVRAARRSHDPETRTPPLIVEPPPLLSRVLQLDPVHSEQVTPEKDISGDSVSPSWASASIVAHDIPFIMQSPLTEEIVQVSPRKVIVIVVVIVKHLSCISGHVKVVKLLSDMAAPTEHPDAVETAPL